MERGELNFAAHSSKNLLVSSLVPPGESPVCSFVQSVLRRAYVPSSFRWRFASFCGLDAKCKEKVTSASDDLPPPIYVASRGVPFSSRPDDLLFHHSIWNPLNVLFITVFFNVQFVVLPPVNILWETFSCLWNLQVSCASYQNPIPSEKPIDRKKNRKFLNCHLK